MKRIIWMKLQTTRESKSSSLRTTIIIAAEAPGESPPLRHHQNSRKKSYRPADCQGSNTHLNLLREYTAVNRMMSQARPITSHLAL